MYLSRWPTKRKGKYDFRFRKYHTRHMMRIFVGLQPSDSFRNALSALQDHLRDAGVTGRFLEPDNLHMTLAFIGEWPEDITHLLPGVDKSFPLRLAHPGIFPEAKVIWAGVEPSAELNLLAQQTRSILSAAGIPFDSKPFVPHITLARKPSIPVGLNLSEISFPSAIMTVTGVCLYRSERGEHGMNYTVIGRTMDYEKRS